MLGVVGCDLSDSKHGKCRILGVMETNQCDGKYIYLVPMSGPKDASHVDSALIKNRKFEFVCDSLALKKLIVDIHVRYGTQDLLVLTEPGELHVVIGSNSTSKGTPQNDSLQKWKDITIEANRKYREKRSLANSLIEKDSVKANLIIAEAKKEYLNYKNLTRQMAKNLKSGPLAEFLQEMFPKKYKRKMPDGSIQEFDADM